MSKDEITKRVITAMIHIGITLDEEDEKNEENIDIRKYIQNSFHFVSFIMELENEFDIVMPDQYLLIDNFASLGSVVISISELLEAK